MQSPANYTMAFTPTWLYIKQHNQTGLKYFGKTIRKDPHRYLGSGSYWRNHLKLHGNDVSTVWCQLFTSESEMIAYAIEFSNRNNIVESAQWANLVIENGINSGGVSGITRSSATREKIAAYRKGRPGNPVSDETRLKLSEAGKRAWTDERKQHTKQQGKSELWYARHAETHDGKPNHLR